jgi:anti-sigma factor RsiW
MIEPETPASDLDDADDEMIAAISDYLDGTLTGAKRDEVAAKIASDAAWKRTHDELVETRKFLSGMQKARAPATFAQDVTDTIHKRSAGRFFARRTFGDRVPFGALLIVSVIALLVIAYLMRSSDTGSLKVRHGGDGTAHEGSGELMPRP